MNDIENNLENSNLELELESDNEKNENPVENYIKLEDVPRKSKLFYGLHYLINFLCFICLSILTIIFFDKEKTIEIFYKKAFTYIVILLIVIFNGYILRNKYNVKVNYTRKINHMCIWSAPYLADVILDIEENTLSLFWNIYFAYLGLILWMIPSREFDKTGILNVCFSTIDRPEDRPNSLNWLAWQNVGVALAVLPFGILWDYWNKQDLLLIPLMILTFGDGLAEPVGIRFGKHKYKVKGLCTEFEYTRSLEGSFMVFLTSIILICCLYNQFETFEFIANLILIPIAATITEAISPHTLDNPLIIIVVSTILTLIHLVERES